MLMVKLNPILRHKNSNETNTRICCCIERVGIIFLSFMNEILTSRHAKDAANSNLQLS